MLRPAYLFRKLTRPCPTSDVGTLRTTAEARGYIVAFPKHRELRQYWQHDCRLILDEAHVAAVSRQFQLALFKDAKLDLEALDT